MKSADFSRSCDIGLSAGCMNRQPALALTEVEPNIKRPTGIGSGGKGRGG